MKEENGDRAKKAKILGCFSLYERYAYVRSSKVYHLHQESHLQWRSQSENMCAHFVGLEFVWNHLCRRWTTLFQLSVCSSTPFATPTKATSISTPMIKFDLCANICANPYKNAQWISLFSLILQTLQYSNCVCFLSKNVLNASEIFSPPMYRFQLLTTIGLFSSMVWHGCEPELKQQINYYFFLDIGS